MDCVEKYTKCTQSLYKNVAYAFKNIRSLLFLICSNNIFFSKVLCSKNQCSISRSIDCTTSRIVKCSAVFVLKQQTRPKTKKELPFSVDFDNLPTFPKMKKFFLCYIIYNKAFLIPTAINMLKLHTKESYDANVTNNKLQTATGSSSSL